MISIGVRDVFASRGAGCESYSSELSQYSFRQRDRFVALGISCGFGKGEAMEFSGTNRIWDMDYSLSCLFKKQLIGRVSILMNREDFFPHCCLVEFPSRFFIFTVEM